MDRESFPTLRESATGWPVMRVPFANGRYLDIMVTEDDERPDRAEIVIAGNGVQYVVEPTQSTEVYMTADGDVDDPR